MVQTTRVPEVTIRDLTMQDYDSVLRLWVDVGLPFRPLGRQVEERLAALGLEITAALIESPNQASLKFFQEIGYTHDPEIKYVSRRRYPDT